MPFFGNHICGEFGKNANSTSHVWFSHSVKVCFAAIGICVFRCVRPRLCALFIFEEMKMEIYHVALIGHRRLDNITTVENEIEVLARDLLKQKEYVEFYVGRNGDFDIAAASAIKRAQRTLGNHNSTLTLVLPYHAKDELYYAQYYDEILFPLPEKCHFKTAITKRNQWIIEHSELLIAYVESTTGGAYQTLKYAEKKAFPQSVSNKNADFT